MATPRGGSLGGCGGWCVEGGKTHKESAAGDARVCEAYPGHAGLMATPRGGRLVGSRIKLSHKGVLNRRMGFESVEVWAGKSGGRLRLTCATTRPTHAITDWHSILALICSHVNPQPSSCTQDQNPSCNFQNSGKLMARHSAESATAPSTSHCTPHCHA